MRPYRLHRNALVNRLRRALPMLISPWLLACGTTNQVARTPPEKMQATAEFYWEYAALAANAYDTAGRVDPQFRTTATSSWIRDEIEQSPNSKAKRQELRTLLRDEEEKMYWARVSKPAAEQPHLSAVDNFVNQTPSDPKECDYDGGKLPLVPMVAVENLGWEPVFELHRQLYPRGWSFFVPGLVIDVWRRERPPAGESRVIEYAVVYRGTAGTGGWFSNLRAFTAFTPAVWDQYRQAEIATEDLIAQIDKQHRVSDKLFKREAQTQIRITAVGHSLGGGLAKYVLMKIPRITRVVAFDPSPVDGSSQFTPMEVSAQMKAEGKMDRQSVLDGRPSDTRFFVLYEDGSAMTKLAGCSPGPIWGSEGGPTVHCDSVNLSHGSMIHQHNMSQLACKLYLAKNGHLAQQASR